MPFHPYSSGYSSFTLFPFSTIKMKRGIIDPKRIVE